MTPFRVIALTIIGVAAILGAAYGLNRQSQQAEDPEIKRRQRLNQIGRITDGTVLDVQEVTDQGREHTLLLMYSYDVAGVTYEASQDITRLRHLVDVYSCRLGIHSSIKYDPHNPGDSLVISEDWSGLASFPHMEPTTRF